MKERCLAQIMGSCRGCDIATMAKGKILHGEPKEETVKRISEELCPDGLQIDEEVVKREKSSLW